MTIVNTPICPEPDVSIRNLKVVNGMASCDITFDAGVGTTGDVDDSSIQRYNGASWDTSIEILYHAFQEGTSGTFHVEWEMVQAGDCVVAVNIGNMCGKRSGFERSELRWDNADAELGEEKDNALFMIIGAIILAWILGIFG